MPSISVVIPVYKVEKYLRQCVESVLAQDYKNIEVILVNDGSPDNCPAICDEIALRDHRIKVIHKENGGASDARNKGLSAAEGEYILFLDSDDYWIGTNGLNDLIHIIDIYKNVDIIYFNRVTFYENLNNKALEMPQIDLEKVNGKNKTDVLSYFIGKGQFVISANNKLVRRNILTENDIFFEKGLVGEDIDWNFKLTLCAENLFAINNSFYAYRKRDGSVTSAFGTKNAKDLLYIIKKWSKYIEDNVLDKQQKNLLLGYCAYLLGILMGSVKRLKVKIVRKELEQEMLTLRYLLNYNVNFKTNKVQKLYQVFGFNITCWLLSFYIYMNERGFKYSKS
jgi:glycosyltransferase involved in cell wall biosynthesis